MLTEPASTFLLSACDPQAPAPVLTAVDVQGRLDALLFELTLRQTYRNTSDSVLEVLYTFPLPAQAVLLGFASELNGQRLTGQVVPARSAERAYEAALDAGDAPVMLEALGALHTASLGNLNPGDTLVLECRFAQWLSVDQGRVRVSLPTTIAPRFGSPRDAGLQPHQVPQASLEADYPLTLAVSLGPAYRGAALACPTHPVQTLPEADGRTLLRLAPGARMDRDVVLLLTPAEARPSLLCTAPDARDPSAPFVALAVLQPAAAAPAGQRALKLLVDGSGSMAGDGIASARAALRGVLDGLQDGDVVSLSAFGNHVEHRLEPVALRPVVRRRLAGLVDALDAELGGTEMEAALQAVFALPVPGSGPGADVLLLTDGEVWNAEGVVAAAAASGHRIFAIGVGSAPAESLLRDLAEATGGACEFATPGEALEDAARRMLQRMRQPRVAGARMDWGQAPVWTTRLPRGLFAGDTVLGLAGLRTPPHPQQVRLLADGPSGEAVELARAEAAEPCPGDTLARMAGARRMAETSDEPATALALRYQLMGPGTRCLIVHEREAAERATESPVQRTVPSMLAAGWGGFGAIRKMAHPARAGLDEVLSAPTLPIAEVGRVSEAEPLASSRWRLRRKPDPTSAEQARAQAAWHQVSLVVWTQTVAEQLAMGGLPGLAERCDAAVSTSLLPAALRAVLSGLDAASGPALDRDARALLLAAWLIARGHVSDDPSVVPSALAWIDRQPAGRQAPWVQAAWNEFDQRLQGWTVSTDERTEAP